MTLLEFSQIQPQQTALSLQTLSMVVMAFATGTIGYFLKQFADSVKELKESVSELSENLTGHKAGCTEKHIAINGRMKQHDSEIDDLQKKTAQNDKEIAIIKETKPTTKRAR